MAWWHSGVTGDIRISHMQGGAGNIVVDVHFLSYFDLQEESAGEMFR